jgi:hypothetical protein
MRVPITVKCECGHVTQALAGDEVTCECGRVYETALSREQRAALTAFDQRMRVFARLGTGVVGLIALAGFLLLDRWAGLAALLVAGGLWWVVLQPIWRRKALAQVAAQPPATVQPK